MSSPVSPKLKASLKFATASGKRLRTNILTTLVTASVEQYEFSTSPNKVNQENRDRK